LPIGGESAGEVTIDTPIPDVLRTGHGSEIGDETLLDLNHDRRYENLIYSWMEEEQWDRERAERAYLETFLTFELPEESYAQYEDAGDIKRRRRDLAKAMFDIDLPPLRRPAKEYLEERMSHEEEAAEETRKNKASRGVELLVSAFITLSSAILAAVVWKAGADAGFLFLFLCFIALHGFAKMFAALEEMPTQVNAEDREENTRDEWNISRVPMPPEIPPGRTVLSPEQLREELIQMAMKRHGLSREKAEEAVSNWL